MAFCTNCGASVTCAFCNQCGTPAGAARAPAPPPAPAPMATPTQAAPMQAAPMQAAPVQAAPAPRRTSPIVWILVIILGLFMLGGIAIVGTGAFLVHKARQAGLDSDLLQRNPGYAVAKLLLAANPDVEEVSHNDRTGTITVRDKKSGKVSTWNFDDIKNGKFKISAEGDNGERATMEFGGSADKLPSWVPAYPGAKAEGTFSVRGDSGDGSGAGGNFTFTTPDSPSKVLSFYEDKAKELGMKINLSNTTGEGGMVMAADEDSHRSLNVVVGGGSGSTTVNVTYGLKR